LKISLNWLKEYVDLEDLSSEEIINKLTMIGLEVEDAVDQNQMYKDFIVGLVKEKTKHPNADKLSLCSVSTGKQEYQVICGAPNVEAGQKIIFAPIGTVIPKGNFKLSKAKIRGIESYGMICSEAELELGDNHDGIMVLDKSVNEGMPITEALELNDVVMEIGITPNRSDALSHIGIARDLCALLNRELKIPEIKLNETGDKIEECAGIEIIDEVNCPRYSGRVIRNVTIKESPQWLKNKLEKVGLRPICNAVDVTNYVMYECGQPLHAFDLDRLAGNKIIVRSTESESKFTTLDSKERTLPAGTLMICDAEKPVALAGLMGGENSEVYPSTKNILLESAHFKSANVRRASKALGLTTDASYRFERGVDPNNTVYAVERAAQLIAELSGGSVAKGVIDVYPQKIARKEVQVRFERIKKILGYDVPKDKIVNILLKLGLEIIFESNNELRVLVPAFRPDIEREVDLIEEIARIDGYENIPTISKITITLGEKHDESEFADNVRDAANALGLYEMINNPLQSEKLAGLTGNPILLLNPQSIDMAYLRTSLIPGALSVISNNIKHGERDLALFEIGNVFEKLTKGDINSFSDFTELQSLLIIITGKIKETEWHSKEKYADFFTLKGLVEGLLYKFSLDNLLNDSYYHDDNRIYNYYFSKNFNNTVFGSGGEVKKDVLRQFDIDQKVYAFEFNLGELKKLSISEKKYSEPVKFPKVMRDFAFIFDKTTSYNEIISFIRNESKGKEGSGLLKSVKLFDLFENESIGSDKRSLAFSLEYQAEDRTLTEDEVEKEFLRLISSVTKKFNAKLRGK
jgi:phenylalanyl-tRNA synthetase beta chain